MSNTIFRRLLAALTALAFCLCATGAAEASLRENGEAIESIPADAVYEELEGIELFGDWPDEGDDAVAPSFPEESAPPAETETPVDTEAPADAELPADAETPGDAEAPADTEFPTDAADGETQGDEILLPEEDAEAEEIAEEGLANAGEDGECLHQLYVDYEYSGEAVCQSRDKSTHTVTVQASCAVLRCALCGLELARARVDRPVRRIEPHYFEKLNGKYQACRDCGYKIKTCKHSKTHALNGDRVTLYAYFDARSHLRQTIECQDFSDLAVVCNACGMRGVKQGRKVNWSADYVSDNLGEGVAWTDAALEPHAFEGGVCTICGMGQTFETLDLNAGQLTLGVKETFQLTVGGIVLRAGSGVRFESSDAAVATVDADTGKITGKKVGEATITAAADYGPVASVTVTVRKAPSKIRLSAGKATLGAGEELHLTSTLQPADAASAVTFSSGKTAVATVDADGRVVAVKPGTATITVKTFNGKKATCKVTVKPAPTAVTLSLPVETMSVGQVRQGSAKLNKGSAGAWRLESSDEAVVAVEGASFTARAPGSADIAAVAYNGVRSPALRVSVVEAPESIRLNAGPEPLVLGAGEKFTLEAAPDRDAPMDLTFVTSNKAAATVSDAGLVTGKKPGTTVITVSTHNGLTEACTVNVLKAPGKISISPSKKTIYVDDALTVTATLPANTASRISFTTSNAKVVEILEASEGVCRVRALKTGSATITAKTFNGKKAYCKLTVKKPVLPTGVTLDYDFIGVPAGGAFGLKAAFTPAGTTRRGLIWSSENEAVARVEDGVVRGVAEGETVIHVRAEADESVRTACRVRVTAAGAPVPVAGISLTGPDAPMRVGATQRLTAVARPANAAYRALRWYSSDASVASVTSDGQVRALKDGSAVITAEALDGGGASASVTIVVRTVTYRALLVSESDFYGFDGWERIKRNRGDVTKLSRTLKGVQGAEGGKFTVTTRDNTTRAELKSLIASTFADADENDVSLFFIATHGNSSAIGDNAAALSMYSPRAAFPEMVRISELSQWLLAVPGKVIVILESCGSGGAIYAANGDGDIAYAVPDMEDIAREAARFDAEAVRAFAGIDPGIPEDDGLYANTGELRVVNKFYVLTASMYQENSYGYEGRTSGNFFTDWLAEGIGKSGNMPADKKYGGNKNGIVDLHELYRYISGVGDNYAVRIGGVRYYQHVQVYPDERYGMFR